MTTRSEREKALKLNEQHQVILSKMLREEENKYCCDCEAKGNMMGCSFTCDIVHVMSSVCPWLCGAAADAGFRTQHPP